MGELLNIVTPLHKRTKRDYIGRMRDEKVKCSLIARKYDKDYWDGDRRFGYGGYKYDGRWEVVAQKLIDNYNLSGHVKILDVGCGKGFLAYEFKKLLPQVQITGFDISKYGLENAKEEIKSNLFIHKAQDTFSFKDKEFDLVISLGVVHNLHINELKSALSEIERVGKNKYIMMESYKSEEELFNLQCWALTCESFFRPQGWVWLFDEFGYTGDYEFIYFE
ncbi:MAG: class I SAM-dependent methyltransferase [Candidatus Omnitrophica bacterium]|nr:class I SAM-dependent methyltransferase [Candidatus Omnitrophota bacterium]